MYKYFKLISTFSIVGIYYFCAKNIGVLYKNTLLAKLKDN